MVDENKDELLETLLSIKKNGKTKGVGFYLPISRFGKNYQNDFQQEIVIGLFKDVFRRKNIGIFLLDNGDILAIYIGKKEKLSKEISEKIINLFAEVEYIEQRFQKYNFSSEIDDLIDLYQKIGNNFVKKETAEINEVFTLTVEKIKKNSCIKALRKQPICAYKNGSFEEIYSEVYFNIEHLSKIVDFKAGIASDRNLFKEIKPVLDRKLMGILSAKEEHFSNNFFSINLNTATIDTDVFKSFCDTIIPHLKSEFVFELQFDEICTENNNKEKYLEILQKIKNSGFDLCLDGLQIKDFSKIKQRKLDFDIAKIFWHEGLLKENEINIAEIMKNFSNRVVLCRCDSEDAISFGKEQGISLYQGRYIDKIINPHLSVIN